MENTSNNVPQWQRALVVSDDSIFEDFGPLRPNLVPMNPIVALAAVERGLQPMDQVKQRFLDFRRWLIGRTRRLLKPIERGNNQHGRTGKRRCLQCRTWKQKVATGTRNCLTCKCEYVNVADPCKVCREKGLRCAASDKIWGNARRLRQAVEGDRAEIQVRDVEWPKDDDGIEEIPRQPPTPDENTLGPVDGALLQFFMKAIHNDWHHSVYYPIDGRYQRTCESLGDDVFQRFGPTLSSTAVRNAVLLLSLRNHLRHHNHELLDMEYKDRFYGAMRKAISTHAYIDVLYASYFACFAALFDLESPS